MVVGKVDARLVVLIDWDRSTDELTRDALNYVYDPQQHFDYHGQRHVFSFR